MPDDWDNSPKGLTGNQWNICCFLKNYNNEIEEFIETVLPLIAIQWNLEVLYEEWDTPQVYTKEKQ